MKPKELTIRGLILGALITTVFTAANVYLGLKVGLTFASSIPAAVISMAILSMVKDSSILENNIVQTVASAAGTLSAIIFVLPGLIPRNRRRDSREPETKPTSTREGGTRLSEPQLNFYQRPRHPGQRQGLG